MKITICCHCVILTQDPAAFSDESLLLFRKEFVLRAYLWERGPTLEQKKMNVTLKYAFGLFET